MTPTGPGPGRAGADPGACATDTTRDLLGTPVRVACTSAAVGAAVEELWRPFPIVSEPTASALSFLVVDGCLRHGRRRCIHTGGEAADVAGDDSVALSWLATAVNRAVLDRFAGLAVHAAVVASGPSVVAVPAPSGAGKTTLTAAALLAGFAYVSDEALCLDPHSGLVVAYPRALALSAWSRQALGLDRVAGVPLGGGEVAIPPARLGARVAVSALALTDIVLIERRPGPSSLVPADRAEAMTWLVERSFNHYKRPAESFEQIAALARRAGAWRLACGDPLEAAAVLRDRFG